jgi:hypothetical protein
VYTKGAAGIVRACSSRRHTGREYGLVSGVCRSVGGISINLKIEGGMNTTVSNEWYTITVSGPVRVISTCSAYVPGNMNMDRELLSLGNELSAAVRVANSPEVVVPLRTIIAPDGGVVLDAAFAY